MYTVDIWLFLLNKTDLTLKRLLAKLKMKVKYTVYLLKDSLGNTDYAIAVESCDTVFVPTLKKPDGTPSYFESEADKLRNHCEQDGIELKTIEIIEEFDEIWAKAVY